MEAREAIRGVSALVDGAHFVYALWQADEATRNYAEELLTCDIAPTDMVHGAIVKANDSYSRHVGKFVRDLKSGILIDRRGELSEASAQSIHGIHLFVGSVVSCTDLSC